jgi:hypothetical protein
MKPLESHPATPSTHQKVSLMNVHSHSTFDATDESLDNARWFLTNRRFLMALETLRNALAFCNDTRRDRIAALVSALEAAPISMLPA